MMLSEKWNKRGFSAIGSVYSDELEQAKAEALNRFDDEVDSWMKKNGRAFRMGYEQSFLDFVAARRKQLEGL